MATLPPPATQAAAENTLEKKVYSLVENYKANIPIDNDRNRLAFNLFNYMRGEGDPPNILLSSAKIKVEGIGIDELANKLSEELKGLK